MKSERWQQVNQLYHSTLEKEVDQRADFLAEACAGDEALRREVESLLSYEDQAENFIESPALDVAAKLVAKDQNANVLAGQTINQYKIITALAAGGMGEVYLAEDTRLKRRVALKFLPSHLTQDKKYLHRFEQEARVVAAMSHPNVCMIHEVIETGEGHNCIVMEYVNGLTLRQRIAEGRMPVREAIEVAIQAASALSAAHAVGIVHRDIKLENIMLRRDGYVKVLDFGLAKLSEAQDSLSDPEAQTVLVNTTPGVVMGTVSYMSPEQARGLPVDARTDVWSLGVVLYAMVAGEQPFTGATATDVIISIAQKEPTPLISFAPDIPHRLDQIVKKALAKDRKDRYQTANDLLTDLKSLRRELDLEPNLDGSHEAITAKHPTVVTRDDEVSTSGYLAAGVKRSRGLPIGAVIGLLIIAGLAAALYFRRSSTPAEQPPIQSLAVLPLDNLSGDPAQEYFADGMTDALITDLAKIAALRVISRPSVMQYKGARRPLPEIGRELKVDAVLTGSVVRSGDRVRIAVQMFQVATDRNLWADSYERDLRDVLALQKDLTRDIVGEIRVKLTTQEQTQFGSARPVVPEAYDHYLRGKFYLNRQTRENNEAAITALERAVTTDPSFAAAHAELAQAYVWKLFLFSPGEEHLAEKAFVAAEKALDLDPDLAVAHLARGRLLWTPANHFPHEKAIREYQSALALNPNLDEARSQLALVYSHIGLLDEAIEEAKKAIAINPNNNLAQFRIGEALNFEGKYEEALSVLRSLPKDSNPSLVDQHIVWSLFNLGRKEEASAALEELLQNYRQENRGLFISLQAVLAASAGQGSLAEEKIKLALESGKGFGHFHHTAYYVACAYALMNKPEQAIKWLDAVAEDGFPCYPLFEKDPNLNNLRQDARFVAFLERQKQQWEHYKSIL